MARTFLRQSSQIRTSDTYDDTLTVTDAESSAISLEGDLNYIRSQMLILSGRTNWYDALEDGFDLQSLHDKALTYWVGTTTDITVPSSQNYVILGTGKPSDNIAIATTAFGSIVAQLSGAIGSHATDAAANNGNLCLIRDSATNKPLEDSGENQIYGLIQVGSGATDGNSFSDSGDDRGQISFVYIDPSTEVITAVAVADIENLTIEYAYRKRSGFYDLPEIVVEPSVDFFTGSTGGVGGVADHGALTGLSDDDHSIYPLLAGRSGGQTLIGGDASSNNFTVRSTSHATKGNVIIEGPHFTDEDDATKIVDFEISGVTTATTRTLTMADRDLDLSTPVFDQMTVGTANNVDITTAGIDYTGTARPQKPLRLTAAGGWGSVTDGAAGPSEIEFVTNGVNLYVLDFDQTTMEYAEWTVPSPENWDGGTMVAKFIWLADTASTSSVAWRFQGRSFGDGEAIDQAWGTVQIVADANNGQNQWNTSLETSAITLAGTPEAGEILQFRVSRDPLHVADLLAADARLIAVSIKYTVTKEYL